MQLRQGQVCTALVTPPRGEPKVRPIIIVSRDADIAAESHVHAVAISTTFDLPLSEDLVELPWEQTGRCVTGLNRRSVAVCHWLVRISKDQIQAVKGITPAPALLRILERVRILLETSDGL